MKTMYETIYYNAKVKHEDKYPVPPVAPLDLDSPWWCDWLNFWYEAADNLHKQFIEENLTQSAEYLLNSVEYQYKWAGSDLKRINPKYIQNMRAR